MKISICGKGGSGKSTLTSLLANQAILKGFSVLVVDSDESNSGLFRMLGFEKPPIPLMELAGGKKKLKREMGQPNILAEKQISLGHIPSQHILRKNGLMLVSIGKILQALEGCACPMGVLNREFLRKLPLRHKEIALIDMEAGVEHFGRGIDASIDNVLLVIEPSLESITLAERIKALAGQIKKDVWGVLNKISSEPIAFRLSSELKKRGIDIIGVIPNDNMIFEACFEGRPFGKGEANQAAGEILDALLSKHYPMNLEEICA